MRGPLQRSEHVLPKRSVRLPRNTITEPVWRLTQFMQRYPIGWRRFAWEPIMRQPAYTRAQKLRQYAAELETLADHVEQSSTTIARAEMLIAEGERIGRGVYAVFRG